MVYYTGPTWIFALDITGHLQAVVKYVGYAKRAGVTSGWQASESVFRLALGRVGADVVILRWTG